MKPKLTFANVVALIALFISLGGTVYAAAKINGKTIRKESIPANRLKPDSVGGAQVDEAALAPVPRAQRAEKALKALRVDDAPSAGRADLATTAASATEATRANLAAEADHARRAELAPLANDARELGGLQPSSYLRQGCAEQTIKVAVLVEPVTGTTNVTTGKNFNCAAGGVGVTVPREGEYVITFDKAPQGIPVVGAMSSGSKAAVQSQPDGRTFTVTVYGTVIEGLVGRPFVLAFF
ncbi:MAG TPA: hypothetical protein VMS60_05070 [Solirubrobacterales bacterium]|nr:hypothetical protein [Solirubrobacterales bacterium]